MDEVLYAIFTDDRPVDLRVGYGLGNAFLKKSIRLYIGMGPLEYNSSDIGCVHDIDVLMHQMGYIDALQEIRRLTNELGRYQRFSERVKLEECPSCGELFLDRCACSEIGRPDEELP